MNESSSAEAAAAAAAASQSEQTQAPPARVETTEERMAKMGLVVSSGNRRVSDESRTDQAAAPNLQPNVKIEVAADVSNQQLEAQAQALQADPETRVRTQNEIAKDAFDSVQDTLPKDKPQSEMTPDDYYKGIIDAEMKKNGLSQVEAVKKFKTWREKVTAAGLAAENFFVENNDMGKFLQALFDPRFDANYGSTGYRAGVGSSAENNTNGEEITEANFRNILKYRHEEFKKTLLVLRQANYLNYQGIDTDLAKDPMTPESMTRLIANLVTTILADAEGKVWQSLQKSLEDILPGGFKNKKISTDIVKENGVFSRIARNQEPVTELFPNLKSNVSTLPTSSSSTAAPKAA